MCNKIGSTAPMNTPEGNFYDQVARNIRDLGANTRAVELAREFSRLTNLNKYTYNFSWLGRPIIQYPQDIVALQEIVWSTRPELIIETGIAHGGSLILSASMLALLDVCDAFQRQQLCDLEQFRRKVVGIDVEIRPHNRRAIRQHPLSSRIELIEGSSTSESVIKQVYSVAKDYNRIMVCLDSNHTHEHVLKELHAYAPLTSKGSYCIVFDTVIEDMPKAMFPDRPWGPGNNPKTAVWEFLKAHPEFEVDKTIQHKLLITVAPEGYLRRVS
jgi:cephalosporin hydroxylase